jgi:hypothetical protein
MKLLPKLNLSIFKSKNITEKKSEAVTSLFILNPNFLKGDQSFDILNLNPVFEKSVSF